MSKKMKAQVLYEPKVMKLEEIDIPEIAPNEVLVKVIEIDSQGRINLSRKDAIDPPKAQEEE